MAAWLQADKAHKRSAKARGLDVAIAGEWIALHRVRVWSPQEQDIGLI
jgi:signal transduction histidine kinase